MLLFRDGSLDEYLKRRRAMLDEYVREQGEDYLLNVDVPQFQSHLVDRYRVDPLVLTTDQVDVSRAEESIPAGAFPPGFNVYQGKSYPKQVFTFHVPFVGEAQLLRLQPSSFSYQIPEADIAGQELQIRVIDWRDDPESVRGEFDRALTLIESWFENSRNDVVAFDTSLAADALATIEGRRTTLLKRRGVAEALGVPVRAAADVPPTFAVPRAAKRLAIAKPAASGSGYAPEPALGEDVYEQILRVIRDAGEQMESHPSLHEGKDEEALRDALLLALVPNFDSATGETFHKKGKTDILVRHEGVTLFIAECLIWAGPAYYLKKIDQALKYLTWRDSKAALVVFSRNKTFQPVLDAVEGSTPQHPCFVTRRPDRGEGSFSYRFRLPEDESRGVSLAVMCFDFH